MTENYSAEIYRQNGDPFRSIRLGVCPDGSIKMDAQDKGKLVEEYGVTTTTSSGSTFRLRRSINWCSLYFAKSIPAEPGRLMNFVLSAREKGLNTNGKVGRNL